MGRIKLYKTPTVHTLPNLEPVVQPYIPLGPVHDMDKVIKEKEQDYDIPLNNNVRQPLTPQTVHITPSGDDYVAPATNPMSNKQLNKFKEEFSNITKGVEKGSTDRGIYRGLAETHNHVVTLLNLQQLRRDKELAGRQR
ncbi:hypothetical protein Tco_0173770 [Tanacetum coccineum]